MSDSHVLLVRSCMMTAQITVQSTKGNLLRDGGDVTLVGCGLMVSASLKSSRNFKGGILIELSGN